MKQNFFLSLLAQDGEVSSKRFAGLLLIGAFIAGTVLSFIHPTFTEAAESMAKTSLYVGAGMLGANVVENVMAIAKRTPKQVVIVED